MCTDASTDAHTVRAPGGASRPWLAAEASTDASADASTNAQDADDRGLAELKGNKIPSN